MDPDPIRSDIPSSPGPSRYLVSSNHEALAGRVRVTVTDDQNVCGVLSFQFSLSLLHHDRAQLLQLYV